MPDTLPMWGTIEPHEREPIVTHSPTRHTRSIMFRDRTPAPVIEAAPTDISGVWQPSAAVTETGTPVHRAFATVIRAAPIMVLMAIVAIPLAWFVESGWMLGLGIVALLTLAGYLMVLWVDLSWNSPGSTEAKRINAAYRLKRMELRNSHELRRAIVEAYIEHMEGNDD
jgi:hypothetical protein